MIFNQKVDTITIRKLTITALTVMLVASVFVPILGNMSEGSEHQQFTGDEGDYLEYIFEVEENIAKVSGIKADHPKDIVIPSTVKKDSETYKVVSVKANAFDGYRNTIESITVQSSMMEFENKAFCECSALKSVSFAEEAGEKSYLIIGSDAFEGCSSLESMTLPSYTSEIGNKAFAKCTSLRWMSIPANVETIGKCPFYGCSSLKSIDIDEDNGKYCSENGVLFDKDKTVLIQYPIGNGRVSYVVPDTVKTIGEGAFAYPDDASDAPLSRVFMSYGVENIESEAFMNCAVGEITVPSSVEDITNAFAGCELCNKDGSPVHDGDIPGHSFVLNEEGKCVMQDITFNVFFDENGGQTEIPSMYCKAGEGFRLPESPIWEGYGFIGWHGSDGHFYLVGDYCQMKGNGITFKAIWQKQCTITFDANGGTVEQTSKVVGFHSPIGILPTPTRDGWNFVGWFTEKEGGEQIKEGTICEGDCTVYAHWDPTPSAKCIITFDANGGTVSSSSKTVGYNSQYGELPTPTRDGYKFVGWFTEKEGGEQIDETSICKDDCTLYAHWEQSSSNGASNTTLTIVAVLFIFVIIGVGMYYHTAPKN